MTQSDPTHAMSPPHLQLSSLLVSLAVSASTILRAPVFLSPVQKWRRISSKQEEYGQTIWHILKLATPHNFSCTAVQ